MRGLVVPCFGKPMMSVGAPLRSRTRAARLALGPLVRRSRDGPA